MSWELASGEQTQKGEHRGTSVLGLEMGSHYFHHILFARVWSPDPTPLRGRLRDVGWV